MFHRRQLLLAGAAGLAASAGRSEARQPSAPRLVALEPVEAILRAQVAVEDGGELVGLQCLVGGRPVELLYRGLDFTPGGGWRGKAPVLWPAVGRNAVATPGAALADPSAAGWRWGGRRYPMPMHGFAKDARWRARPAIHGKSVSEVTTSMADTPATRAQYPFGFELALTYRVSGASATISHQVAAARTNTGSMPFSIGNHMTFKIPFAPGGSTDATRLTSSARRQVIVGPPGNMPTGQVSDIDLSRPIAISDLGGQKSTSIGGSPAGEVWTRLEDPAGMAITISHHADRLPPGEPVLFNLWGDLAQGFFAPEPWVGKQYSLARGDGVLSLPPGEVFRWDVAIDVSLFGALATT